MRQFMVALLASAIVAASGSAPGQTAGNASEWPTYGHDSGGMRFSPLKQITPGNVATLEPAWNYHLKPEGSPGGFRASEATPLVIDGVMYVTSPYGQVVALDSTTGKQMWLYQLPTGTPATRGVEYFPGDNETPPQIVVGTNEGKLFTLDAKTGALNTKFGADGVVDLNTPEITHGVGASGTSSPTIVYKNLVIIGSHLPERGGPGPAGDVRAFDIHDGKLAWTFHSIPLKGEPNDGTWTGDSANKRTGDLFGGDRAGNNLYDSSIVAVDAKSGKYLWHFQVVHHDVWDFDLESPPVLMDVKKGGRTIPAVAVFGKSSLLFMLDRVTGKPIYDVTEKPVAQSDVPGEQLSPTQPFPAKPGYLARVGFSMADIATVTPELETNCRKLISDNNILTETGPYAPPTYNRIRVIFPSEIGGADWGGASFNPTLGYLFINVNDLGQLNGLKDPESGPVDIAKLAGTNNRGGRTGPYLDLSPSGRFRDPITHMFCNKTPWGELVAVNVNNGDIAWRVPLGVTDSLPADKQNTGRPGEGGSIATASGLVFIGASDDSRFRAFDAKTGKELWAAKLGASAESVPSTYLGKDGRQYVAVVGTGGGDAAAPVTSDQITVFALPH